MAYSCIVVLRFVTRYSNTKIGIWRFLYRHDDLLKKRISDFLAICAIKLDKRSPQIGQKSPKMLIFGDFWRFLSDLWRFFVRFYGAYCQKSEILFFNKSSCRYKIVIFWFLYRYSGLQIGIRRYKNRPCRFYDQF